MNWRSLTLLLIAANFIYWGWNTWIYEPQNNLVNHRFNVDTPELVIVDEVSTSALIASEESPSRENTSEVIIDGAIEVTTLTTDAALGSADELKPVESNDIATPVLKVCHRVGFFTDKSETERAQAWLLTENLTSLVQTSTENVFAGYWVHLPAYPNSEAAAQVVTALQEKNIKDLFVETRQPNQNAISLGLFRQRNGAEQRLKQIQALGFPAKIINREPEQTVYWLDIEVDEGQVPPLARIPVTEGQVRRLERRECRLESLGEDLG